VNLTQYQSNYEYYALSKTKEKNIKLDLKTVRYSLVLLNEFFSDVVTYAQKYFFQGIK